MIARNPEILVYTPLNEPQRNRIPSLPQPIAGTGRRSAHQFAAAGHETLRPHMIRLLAELRVDAFIGDTVFELVRIHPMFAQPTFDLARLQLL